MKIVFLDAATVGDVPNMNEIQKLGDYAEYPSTTEEQRIKRLSGIDIVIVNKVVIDREVMDACSSLKLICVAATGMNNIDVDAAKQKGIEVKNVTGYSTNSVAQVTFALILELLTHTHYYTQYIQDGVYSSDNLFTHLGPSFRELSGKTFGIIGLGNIGKKVAAIAEAFGSQVIYHSTSGENLSGPYIHVMLKDLLQNSDIVSIHAPLNARTLNLIDEPELKLMKKTSLLINVGRGGIVNEPALARAIDSGTVAGAACDVFTREPLPHDHPFLKIRNKDKLLLLPHIAWASIEARTTLISRIAENIKDFMEK
jgi:glycerate dehydrogenase